MRSGAGKDRVGSLLVRSNVRRVYVDGVGEPLTAVQRRDQAHQADHPREGEMDDCGSDASGGDDTSLGELQRAVLVAPDHERAHLSLARLLTEPAPER